MQPGPALRFKLRPNLRCSALDAYRTQCYMYVMTDAEETAWAFKTAWFTKAARKARIKDDELCEAIEEVRKGRQTILVAGYSRSA